MRERMVDGWRVIALVLCFVWAQSAGAQSAQRAADTPKDGDKQRLEQLRKDMYYHYSQHNTTVFMSITEQIKALAKARGWEREYYKACANQAIYASSYGDRTTAIETAKALYRQAEGEGSRYGLYTAHHALGTIYTALAQFDEAAQHFSDALDILQTDFPDESRSALYLAIAKVDRARAKPERVVKHVRYVMADPKAMPQHRLSAMSYYCIALSDMDATTEERDKAYAEREKVKKELGHDDNFGYIIDFEHAILHSDFDRARQVLAGMTKATKATKALYRSRLAYAMGNYREAYNNYVRYKNLQDSVNNDKVRKSMLDFGIMLDKARAENEAKDLRLANQNLEMDRIASRLRQKDLQEQALALSLAMRETRLREVEAERKNDSLTAYNKDLQVSEMRSQMEAKESEERMRRLKWIVGGILAVVALVFMAVFAHIRHLQLRRLKEAYDKLEETTSAKERIESELRIARNIQMAMVPHEFPESRRLNIYARMKPAREVGGDLYDFVISGDKLYFCLGDVSGKGVPAALFMAMSIRLFRTFCKFGLPPAQIATSMNSELVQNNDNGMFVTMFIGLLDLESGRLDFCNAGHNPPLLDGTFIDMEPNAPLGLWENLDYEGQTLEDISGQQLFVYSDGLNEAENTAQEQYGDDRLMNIIQKHTDAAAHPLIDLVTADVEAHVGEAAPSDDMTMLCLRKKR